MLAYILIYTRYKQSRQYIYRCNVCLIVVFWFICSLLKFSWYTLSVMNLECKVDPFWDTMHIIHMDLFYWRRWSTQRSICTNYEQP